MGVKCIYQEIHFSVVFIDVFFELWIYNVVRTLKVIDNIRVRARVVTFSAPNHYLEQFKLIVKWKFL